MYCCSITAKAQDSLSIHSTDSTAAVTQIDVIDIIHKIKHHSSTPRKDTSTVSFSVLPAVGYSLQTGFAAVISGNAAFYTKKSNTNLSSITSSITYSQYQQIIFPIQANIWTKNNRYDIITDWRYMQYPSTTFGLGGRSKLNNGYTIDFNYLKNHQTLLKNIGKDFFAGMGYYFDYYWNVREIGVKPGAVTDFEKYGLTNKVTASGISTQLLYDSRRNSIHPTNGWYANVVYRPNFTFLGSDDNYQSLQMDVRKYIKLSPYSNNILALWSYNWLSLGGDKPPYLLLPSTGWDDFYNTGRGYVQGRYRGKDMVYLESEYRFGITKNGLIGGVVFANAQSFSKDISKQLEVIAPGYGLGVRIKLNKFSSTNLCIDYGFGTDGSKGISVNLGEVF